MAIWSTQPNDGDIRPATQLLRVKPGKPLEGVITCTTTNGTYLHYWKGRTTPCLGADCEACTQKLSARWYGFLSLWSPRTNGHAIVEITSSCMERINEYTASHGTLRAALLRLRRANNKANARLLAEIELSGYAPDAIPPALDLIDTLEYIWEQRGGRRPQDQQPSREQAQRLRAV